MLINQGNTSKISVFVLSPKLQSVFNVSFQWTICMELNSRVFGIVYFSYVLFSSYRLFSGSSSQSKSWNKIWTIGQIMSRGEDRMFLQISIPSHDEVRPAAAPEPLGQIAYTDREATQVQHWALFWYISTFLHFLENTFLHFCAKAMCPIPATSVTWHFCLILVWRHPRETSKSITGLCFNTFLHFIFYNFAKLLIC